MKKSLLTLLTAILIGSSFTSCVENTIPDEVVAIYDGQANLLAAQAALLAAQANAENANAAMTAAMVALKQSEVEASNIANDYAQANNAILLAEAQASLSARIALDAAKIAEMEAELAIMIAQADTVNAAAIARLEAELAAAAVALATNQATLDNMVAVNAIAQAEAQARLEANLANAVIAAAEAQLALEIAQAEHVLNLEALANQLAMLDDEKIAEYFKFYDNYSALLNANQDFEIDVQLAIIQKVTDIALNIENDELAMAGFSNDIMIAQSAKADLEEQKADLEAAIAAGTSTADNNAKKVLLLEEIAAIETELSDLDVAIAEMDANFMNAQLVVMNLEADLNLDFLQSEFNNARQQLNNALFEKEQYVLTNTASNETIASATAAITDYDATTASLEAEVATTAAAAAVAEDVADAAAVAANNAITDSVIQATRLESLKEDVKKANETVKMTAAAWVAAIENAENSTTQTTVDTRTEEQIEAQAAYTIAKANFDDQTSQTTWGPGEDGRLGIHSADSDNDNTPVATYQFITAINSSSDAEGTTYTATYGEATTTFPTPEEEGTTEKSAADEPKEVDPNDINEDTNVGDYIEFGEDDVPTNDLEEFQEATDKLRLANNALEVAIEANVDVTIAVTEAKAAYDSATNIFENATALVAAQKEVSSAADSLAVSTAEASIGAQDASVDADAAADAAEDDLAIHEATTVAMYEIMIENASVNILQINIYLTNLETTITQFEADLAVILAKLEAGVPDELIAARAEVVNIQLEFSNLFAIYNALDYSLFVKSMTANQINTDYDDIVFMIEGIDDNIATQDMNIATAEANILAFPGITSEGIALINANELAQLEVKLTRVQSNVMLYAALTAKYKALIDSLL